jgi:hypothetical protein
MSQVSLLVLMADVIEGLGDLVADPERDFLNPLYQSGLLNHGEDDAGRAAMIAVWMKDNGISHIGDAEIAAIRQTFGI